MNISFFLLLCLQVGVLNIYLSIKYLNIFLFKALIFFCLIVQHLPYLIKKGKKKKERKLGPN